MGYKIGRPIYTLSNGIDTDFFKAGCRPCSPLPHPVQPGRRTEVRHFGGTLDGAQGPAGFCGAGPPDAPGAVHLVWPDRRRPAHRRDPPGYGGGARQCAVCGVCQRGGNSAMPTAGPTPLCSSATRRPRGSWCWRPWPAASPPCCGISRCTTTGCRTADRSTRPPPWISSSPG